MRLSPEVIRWHAAAHAGASEDTTYSSRMQYEYLIVDIDKDTPIGHLNVLGSLGWELVSVVIDAGKRVAYLKRDKR